MQRKDLKEELKLTHTFKDLIQVYEDAAVNKMQTIRDSVLQSRSFMEEMLHLLAEIKSSYKESFLNKLKKQRSSGDEEKVETVLWILITPMEKMTGSIGHRVVSQFMAEAKNTSADLMVMGKTGKSLLEQNGFSKKYQYIDIPSETDAQLKALVAKIASYDQVKVYRGKYLNLMNQEPVVSDFSRQEAAETQAIEQKESGEAATKVQYIFEPSIEEINAFFDQQILATLFMQTLSEADLAKLGSRITAMESANTNVATRLKDLRKRQLIIQKSIDNHKQLERMAGVVGATNRL